MKHVRKAVAALSAGAAGLFLFAVIGSASAAADRAGQAARPSSTVMAHHIVAFTTPGPLLNAVDRTMQGDHLPSGGCVWHPPVLTLGPGQQAIEARQISADFTACTTVVAIGTPTQIDPIPSGEQVSTVPTRSVQNARGATKTNGYTTSQAYFKVTWWDPVGIDVNHVRSILNWTWGNNGCIIGSVASSAIYAQSGTGWYNTSWNWYKLTSCESHYTYTSADFENDIFCVPPTYTHYNNVWIRGGYQGGYGGNLDSTSATGGCTYLLHWSQQLVKEY
jgi:hypothetical protein